MFDFKIHAKKGKMQKKGRKKVGGVYSLPVTIVPQGRPLVIEVILSDFIVVTLVTVSPAPVAFATHNYQ